MSNISSRNTKLSNSERFPCPSSIKCKIKTLKIKLNTFQLNQGTEEEITFCWKDLEMERWRDGESLGRVEDLPRATLH